jgi:hypothetical protein
MVKHDVSVTFIRRYVSKESHSDEMLVYSIVCHLNFLVGMFFGAAVQCLCALEEQLALHSAPGIPYRLNFFLMHT